MVKLSEEGEDKRVSIVSAYHQNRGTSIVNVRVPQALINKIDGWVEEEHFKSRSEFIVTAIRRYLDDLARTEKVSDAGWVPAGRQRRSSDEK